MFLTMVCRKCVFHQSPAHTYPKQLYGFTKLHSRQCCPSSWPFPFLLSFVVAVSFIYLCLAALGLCFCPRALSSWREQGLLPSSSVQASHCSGVPSCGAQAPGLHSLQCEDFVALQHVESSQIRDRTWVPCIGRWILSHRTHQGSPLLLLSKALVTSLLNSCPKQVTSHCLKGTVLVPHLPPALFYRNKSECVCSLRILGHNQSPPRSRTVTRSAGTRPVRPPEGPEGPARSPRRPGRKAGA